MKNENSVLHPPALAYYAFRHLPWATFEALDALLCFEQTLDQIPGTVQQPALGHQKLAFYKKDLSAGFAGQATHPAVQRLMRALPAGLLQPIDFEPLFYGIEMDIDRLYFSDSADWGRYMQYRGAGRAILCATLLQQRPLSDREKAEVSALGQFMEQVYTLQAWRGHSDPQRLAPDLAQTLFVQLKHPPLTRGVLHKSLLPLLIWSHLYAALLDLQHTVPGTPIALSPFYALGLHYRFRFKFSIDRGLFL